MSGNETSHNRGPRASPLPVSSTSTAKSSYALRKKGRTLAEMLAKDPPPQKRTLTSPDNEEKSRKIFVADQGNSDCMDKMGDSPKFPLSTTGRNAESETTEPDQGGDSRLQQYNDQTENNTQTAHELQKDPSNVNHLPHHTRPELVSRLAEIVGDMKTLCEERDLDQQISKLVQEAFEICAKGNFLEGTRVSEMIEKAKQANDPSDMIKVCGYNWPKDAYKMTTFAKESQDTEMGPITVIFNKRGENDQLEKSVLYNRIPALHRIDPKCPRLVKITYTESIGDTDPYTQEIFLITLDEEATDNTFLTDLLHVKDQLKEDPCDRAITVKTTTGHPVALRKACEMALWKTGVTCTILTDSHPQNKMQTESVRVSPGDMTYADLLKSVKQNINGEELGVRILQAKKTLNGELEIKVKGSAKPITEVIRKNIPGATTTLRKSKKTMHLRDLEEEVTEDEIMDGILNTLPSDQHDSIDIKSIRPAYNNTCNATIQLPEQAALTLQRRGYIQIGLVSARIRMRTETQRCPKCWQEGHSLRDCKGDDMRDKCFRCKETGHQKAQCPVAVKPNSRTGNQAHNGGQ